MKYCELANYYFKKNKEKLAQVKKLEDKRHISLLKKLSQDKNEVNFLSWLSEMKFGFQFDQIAATLNYDKVIDGQTPDWTITSNGQTIVAEVVRINQNEQLLNLKIDDFKQLPMIDKNLSATVTSAKTLDLKYFYGAQDKEGRKEEIYRNLIEYHKFPFIICIDLSETELFTFYNDCIDFFIGDGKNGYFNSNSKFGQNVTGVFILVPFNGFRYINNELAENQLSLENLNDLLNVCN